MVALEPVRVEPEHAVLLVVDMQPDFLPGGALAVGEGDRLVEPLQRLMTDGPFVLQIATQDWHPAGHISFASSHPGRKPMDVIDLYGHEQVLWPDHCVQGSAAAELHPHLPWKRVAAIVRKGAEPEVDSYSAFRNNWNPAGERPPTGLGGYLRERGVSDVFLSGLARDYCVLWTARDAAAAGFTVRVLWDLTRPVDPDADADVRAELTGLGVALIEAEQLRGP